MAVCKAHEIKTNYSPCANMGKCIGRSSAKKDSFPFLCECINGFDGEDCSINSNICGIYGYRKDCDEEMMEVSKNGGISKNGGMSKNDETAVTILNTQTPVGKDNFSVRNEITTPSFHQSSGNSVNWPSYVILSLLVILCAVVFSGLIWYTKKQKLRNQNTRRDETKHVVDKIPNTRCPPTYEESVQRKTKSLDKNANVTEVHRLLPSKFIKQQSTSIK